jgi:hypothetical protein
MSADIDETALHEAVTSWDGDVGVYLRDLLDSGEAVAHARVPWRTGRMFASIRQVHSHDEDGNLEGLLGAGAHAPIPRSHPGWTAGFPYQNALDNTQGYTWNRSPRGRRHTRGARRLHPFLSDAFDEMTTRAAIDGED